MDPRKALLLEMKRKAGLATPAECEALDAAPVVCGNGLVAPRPARDAESWHARWSAAPGHDLFVPERDASPAAEPASPEPVEAPEPDEYGIIQCAPDAEPAPAGRPDYKPATRRRLSRGG